ncbi:hypothetical protein THIOM_003381 [Candidatus Thiomargarita nelsonii]|uniref:Uncharacterized protein n=1 Tax=Candidatus Thiomargarita nelsonii TaxID=1003181 RepID=A0A176RYT9_9GAMM|nr:hypothetical protein THIOM_003381 [Candidatus Thiomargarita nelsonii]
MKRHTIVRISAKIYFVLSVYSINHCFIMRFFQNIRDFLNFADKSKAANIIIHHIA